MRLIAALFCGLTFLVPTTAPAQEFTTLKGHGGPIMGLAVSDQGQVASASFDNSVGLWTGTAPTWLEGHDAAVIDLVFVDDRRIVSGGDDYSVLLWQDGAPHELGRHKAKVSDLELAPTGDWVASASWDGTVALWPLVPGQAAIKFDRQDGGINDVAFAPDGSTLYAATSGGDILIYELEGKETVRPIVRHGFAINELILAPDESWLAYGAIDGVTRVIDPATGTELSDFTLERRPILAMAHHADSDQIAVGDGHGYIMVIDTKTWKIIRDFRAMRDGPVWALAYSPDGGMIYAGGIDDVVYGWPVEFLGDFDPIQSANRSFLRAASSMPNGERQFMRKCSICHALSGDASRKAGPTLQGVFGRPAGAVQGYRYSPVLANSDIIWDEVTIDALFSRGPDEYIPESKMPMQRITAKADRDDLIGFLRDATTAQGDE